MLWSRGLIELQAGRYPAALELFQEAVDADPSDVHARYYRAVARARLGDREGAIADLRGVLAAEPNFDEAALDLGVELIEEQRYDEAEPAFRRAVELGPKLDRAWYGLGLVLIRQRRFDEAVEALERNTRLQPMSPYGWYQLARVQADRQQPDEARKIIRRLQAFEPKVAAQLERETGLAAQEQ